MKIEEYKNEAERLIRDMLKNESQEEVDKLIGLLQDNMEKSFHDSLKASEILGTNQVSPSDYAYGIFMMWQGSAQETIDFYDLK